MDSSFTLYLLRHGITAANQQKRYIGWTDVPLNETGHITTLDMKKNLQGLTVDRVYTSDLQRCIQTAELLFPNHYKYKHTLLREMNFGEWENKTYDILKHNLRYQQWIQAPFSLGSKEGEDFPSFALRIRQALESILVDSFEKHLSRVAVVTHGGVIRLLLHQLVASECTFFDWKIPYSGGYALIWQSKEAIRREERCTLLQEVPITGRLRG